MKKTIYIAFVLVLGIFIYISVPTQNTKLVVGVVLPLTGKFASISEDIQNAIVLAKEQSGKSDIEFVFEDSAGESAKAVSAITNLIVHKKAKVILSGTGSTANIAMSKIAEKYKVPFFAVTSTPELMGKEDYVFTLQPSVTKEVEKMLEHVSKKEYEKVAILYDGTSDSLTAGAKYFREILKSKSVEVFESYAQDGDQNTINLKIKNTNPDFVYILGVDKSVGPIVKKLREIGYKNDIGGFSGIDSKLFLSIAGSSAEGVYLTSVPFSCDSKNAQQYCEQYRSRFDGREPQQYGAFMYEAVRGVIGDKNCISIACFVERGYIDPITGTFDFDKYGDINSDVELILKNVKGGNFVVAK